MFFLIVEKATISVNFHQFQPNAEALPPRKLLLERNAYSQQGQRSGQSKELVSEQEKASKNAKINTIMTLFQIKGTNCCLIQATGKPVHSVERCCSMKSIGPMNIYEMGTGQKTRPTCLCLSQARWPEVSRRTDQMVCIVGSRHI